MSISVYVHSNVQVIGISVGCWKDNSWGYQPKFIFQEKSILLGTVAVENMEEWEVKWTWWCFNLGDLNDL